MGTRHAARANHHRSQSPQNSAVDIPVAHGRVVVGHRLAGLLVHAESAEAKKFYLHLVPEFEPSPPTSPIWS
jgi:hypothetical protein